MNIARNFNKQRIKPIILRRTFYLRVAGVELCLHNKMEREIAICSQTRTLEPKYSNENEMCIYSHGFGACIKMHSAHMNVIKTKWNACQTMESTCCTSSAVCRISSFSLSLSCVHGVWAIFTAKWSRLSRTFSIFMCKSCHWKLLAHR